MTARSALDAARPAIARMDASRGPDATKAELVEVWNAVEGAVRALVGNSSAAGQTLVRDARSRQLLTFDQANALVAFLAVREQVDSSDYKPTDTDVNTARSAFLKLDAGLLDGAMAAPTSAPVLAAPAVVSPPLAAESTVRRPRTGRRILTAVAVILVLVAVIGIPLLFVNRGGSGDALAQAIQAYQHGDRVTASSDFERAARANPNDATPHVYLARMAREVGNFTIANQELQLALKAEPDNLIGRREYGSFFLAQGNYDQARVWYMHALEVDQNDATSQGWLGCALMKLGRPDEGTRWLNRAGNGPWSACRSAATTTALGNIRP